MQKIHTMAVGQLQTNCYLVWDDRGDSCAVIDPGDEPERILAQIEKLGLRLGGILLTHGHFDHVGGVRVLKDATGCPVYLCAEELCLPPQLTAGELVYTHTYGEGDELCLAGLRFRVLQTPGHTPGSVCLVTENAMFSGDTLFACSCGRTDFPGGSWAQMRASLTRLAQLEENYTVYPGHGGSTTLAWEAKNNPYMKGTV